MIITISEQFEYEEFIKKSRFICQLTSVKNEMDAQKLIKSIKRVHSKANHNCSAFILGDSQNIQRANDDGEPSGTAGIPMLEILKKHHLTNTCAIITRYFGGIKLGAGGLIRAYSGIVNRALEKAPLVRIVEQQEICLTLSYHFFDSLQHFLSTQPLTIGSSDFLSNISVNIYMDLEKVDNFLTALTEMFNGKVKANKIGKRSIKVPI